MSPPHLKIEVGLAQALVNYLATKPWIEVKDFIPALMALQPITEAVTDGLAEERDENRAS